MIVAIVSTLWRTTMNKLLCVVSVVGILCSGYAKADDSNVVRGMACTTPGATSLNYNQTEILSCLGGFWHIAETANLPQCEQNGQVATTDGVNINCVNVLPPICQGTGHYLQFDGTNWMCVDVSGNLITNNTAVSPTTNDPVTVPAQVTPQPSSQGDNCHLSSQWDNQSLGQNRNQSLGW
jgi:hypothetical protein